MPHKRLAEVLLVDDDINDVFIMKRALDKANVVLNLHHVSDGVEAMQFLKKENPYTTKPTPDLILLDLRMPRKDGLEVLKDIKNDRIFKVIPVCILTTSSDDQDVINSYSSYASAYITKPVDLEQLKKIVAVLDSFWFSIVTLPRLR